MNTPKLFCAALCLLTLSLGMAGCDRTVSEKKSTTVNSDGTVKSKETTVTEKADGTVVKKEETTKTTRP